MPELHGRLYLRDVCVRVMRLHDQRSDVVHREGATDANFLLCQAVNQRRRVRLRQLHKRCLYVRCVRL